MASSAAGLSPGHLAPPLALNEDVTRGRQGRGEPTYGRSTWLVIRPETMAELPQTWSGRC